MKVVKPIVPNMLAPKFNNDYTYYKNIIAIL